MDSCWPVSLFAVGLPSAAAAYLLAKAPGEWGYIVLGWGVAVLALLAFLAGTDLFIPTADELDLFGRIRDAFTVVCGPAPFAAGLIGGGLIGYVVHEATERRSAD